jgi:hypothetical protein
MPTRTFEVTTNTDEPRTTFAHYILTFCVSCSTDYPRVFCPRRADHIHDHRTSEHKQRYLVHTTQTLWVDPGLFRTSVQVMDRVCRRNECIARETTGLSLV